MLWVILGIRFLITRIKVGWKVSKGKICLVYKIEK